MADMWCRVIHMSDARIAADQERRRSNAAQPIPAGKYKQPRSMAKQELREQRR